MKKIIVVLLAALFGMSAKSQVANPVVWSATYKAISSTEGEIIIQAKIEKGWHTYSQRPTEAGPIPTNIAFVAAPSLFELIGKTNETDAHEEFVKAFDAKIFVFTDKAEFRQKIKLKGKGGFNVTVKVEYMTCNDMMCLPPKTIDLSVKIQ